MSAETPALPSYVLHALDDALCTYAEAITGEARLSEATAYEQQCKDAIRSAIADAVAQRERSPLERFALAILKQWHGDGERGDVDGGWIQHMAVTTGVVSAVPVAATPCGDVCPCAEWAGHGERVVCYRILDDGHAMMTTTPERPNG